MSVPEYTDPENNTQQATNQSEATMATSNPPRYIRVGFSFAVAITIPLLAIAWTGLTLVACIAPSVIPGILSVRPVVIACDVLLCSAAASCWLRVHYCFKNWRRFEVRNPADLTPAQSTTPVDSKTSEPALLPGHHWWTDTPLREEVRQSVGR